MLRGGGGRPANKRNKQNGEDEAALTFDVLRHVVVEHHGDVVDIDTSASDVRGHQDVFGSRLEVREGKLSLLLAFAAVQRAGVVLREEERSGGYASSRVESFFTESF